MAISLQYEKNADGTNAMKSYTYTPDNLLATATFDGKTLTNAWDADENRVGFTVNSTNHTFVYDISAGIPAVIQEDGIYYIREPAGELIARLDGPNMNHYHFALQWPLVATSHNSGNTCNVLRRHCFMAIPPRAIVRRRDWQLYGLMQSQLDTRSFLRVLAVGQQVVDVHIPNPDSISVPEHVLAYHVAAN